MYDFWDLSPRVMAPYSAEINFLQVVISTVISVSGQRNSEALNFLTLYLWRNGVSDGA